MATAAPVSGRPVVFLGPTIPRDEARQHVDADFRPPCRRGDLEGLEAGSVVGLIDGVFHQSLAVSPREIVGAIGRGISVLGSSSMGALRAAEVPGMKGVGSIFEMYQRGLIDSDDEVAIVFDPERLIPLTVPLVNIRHAVTRLHDSGTIPTTTAQRIVSAASSLHYTERTHRRIVEEAGFTDDVDDIIALLRGFDLKKDDARLLLDEVSRLSSAPISCDIRLPPPKIGVMARPFSGSCAATHPRDADSPVHIWEMGATVDFSALLDFLKTTGRFMPHAQNVLIRLLVEDARSVKMTVPPNQACGSSTLTGYYSSWGWRTSEEVEVTSADVGVDRENVLARIQADQRAHAALIYVATSTDERTMRALRTELFVADIALKREAMVYDSLAVLAGREAVLNEQDLVAARQLLCRLHGVDHWSVVSQALSTMGVTATRTEEFARCIAGASRAYRRILARDERAVDLPHLDVPASPKPSTEARFATKPSEALAMLEAIKTAIGITRVAMVDRLADISGVFVSQAARPDNRWSSTYGSGKSVSREGAIIGGILEEAEKWAQEQFTGTIAPTPFHDKPDDGSVLDPATLDLPFDSLYSSTLPISWHECIDHMSGKPIRVPLAALAMAPRVGPNNIFYSARGRRHVLSTNGLASGFSLAEALLHASCEVIERHATKLSELRISNPGLRNADTWPRLIDLGTLGTDSAAIVASLLRGGYQVALWDITSEVRVPTICAWLSQHGQGAPGYAAHPNPHVAALMALLEACQSIVGTIAGGREDLSPHARSLGRHERPRPRRAAADAFWSGAGSPAIPITSIQGFVASDIRDEYLWVRTELARAGLTHLLVLDLTRPEIAPVRVVRVIIPGLDTTNPFHYSDRARAVLAGDVVLA